MSNPSTILSQVGQRVLSHQRRVQSDRRLRFPPRHIRRKPVGPHDLPLLVPTIARAAWLSCDRMTRPAEVLELCAALCRTTVEEMRDRPRKTRPATARRIAYWIMRERCKMVCEDIAASLGKRGWAQVVRAVEWMERLATIRRMIDGPSATA